MRGHRRFSGAAAAILSASLCITLAFSSGSDAATMSQVRNLLRAWHLHPPPLFPAKLPAIFSGSQVFLSHPQIPAGNTGLEPLEFEVVWNGTRHVDSYGDRLVVSYVRGGPHLLNAVLHDTATNSVQRKRIGRWHTYSIVTGHSGCASGLLWQARGRTYLLCEKYAGRPQALRTLSPFVKSRYPLG